MSAGDQQENRLVVNYLKNLLDLWMSDAMVESGGQINQNLGDAIHSEAENNPHISVFPRQQNQCNQSDDTQHYADAVRKAISDFLFHRVKQMGRDDVPAREEVLLHCQEIRSSR